MPETPYIPESNKGIIPSPEVSEEPTSAQIAEACRGVLSEEDRVDIEGMEFGDALGYAFSLLLTNGVEDPEAFLVEKGLLEPQGGSGELSLPESLGFVEDAELKSAHMELAEALRTGQDVSELAANYQTLAEAMVSGMEDYPRGQIALIVQLGLIAQEAGHKGIYIDYLEQARAYAYNLGLGELVDSIDRTIDGELGLDNDSEVVELRRPAALYHASRSTEIEEFEPRAESVRDKEEGPMVFASPDKAFATCFLVPTDDSWAKIGRYSEHGKRGPWHVVVSDRERFEALDHGGAIYALPSESFSTDPDKGVGVTEWTSPVAVRPIAKEIIPSGLQAMLEAGVQVYFVDRETFERIKHSDDHGKAIVDGLTPFQTEV
jgi:hypothetical protein